MSAVARVQTTLTEVELALALRDGHVLACGAPPSASRLSVGWAQCALEHARGRAVYCFNLGNVTAGSRWAGDYYELTCSERVKRNPDVWQTIDLHFRAHQKPADGGADYWRILSGRYIRALAYFDRADAEGAAYLLSQLGYYTALPKPYAAAMASLERYAAIHVAPSVLAAVEPARGVCETPDCDGELRSYLSPDAMRAIEATVAMSLADLTRDPSVIPIHGDPNRTD